MAFVNCAMHTKFVINDSQVRAALTTAITEPWGSPHDLCQPALSLIMLNRRIASCVRFANGSWPARLPKAALFGAHGLAALAADPLLTAVLEAAPVSTIEFERFLTCARHALLETASNKQEPDPSDIVALQFYAVLSRQCFVNEYIFDCGAGERLAAEPAARSYKRCWTTTKRYLPCFCSLSQHISRSMPCATQADFLLKMRPDQ